MATMQSILDTYSDKPACLDLVTPYAAPLCGPDNGLWHQFSVAGDVFDLARAVAWLDAVGLLGGCWRAVYDSSDPGGIDLLICDN